jgi:hypothetical protein
LIHFFSRELTTSDDTTSELLHQAIMRTDITARDILFQPFAEGVI